MNTQTSRIDQWNILLLVLAAWAAWVFPFRLFLLAYAVLGPLHYLTEMFWLEKQNYFLADRRGGWWLLGAGVLLTALVILSQWPAFINLPGMRSWREPLFSGLVFLAFLIALLFTFPLKGWIRAVVMVVGVLAAVGLSSNGTYALFFGMLLATVIHIALFTWLFMLFGALKARSVWGLVAALCYLVVVGWFWKGPLPAVSADWSASVEHVLVRSGFAGLNQTLQQLLWGVEGASGLQSEAAHRIQALLAFGYTYHYLNWFSKIDIIRWHQVKKSRVYLTLAVWLLAVGLYAFRFQVGLLALFLLSIWHVFLEFPLNYRCVVGIFPAARAWLKNPAQAG